MKARIDFSALTERANKNLPASEKFEIKATRGAIDRYMITQKLMFAEGFEAQLHKVVVTNDEPRIWIRIDNDVDVTYVQLVVSKTGVAPVMVDFYETTTGEFFSESIGRLIPLSRAAQKANDQSFTEDIKTAAAMTVALANEDYQEVLTLYEKLSAMKTERTVQVVRLQAASGLDAATLERVITEFEKTIPNDIASNLSLVYPYIDLEKYDKAMASVDLVDAGVQNDPYLNLLRADVRESANDVAGAKKFLLTGLNADPTLEDLANRMCDYAVYENNFAETKRWLLHLEKHCGYEFEADLDNSESFEAFKKSPEYQAWLKEKKP
ncbi:MAG TPA: hypothetical protein PK402_09875 [Tepidisphaeraceae bacterium]|nr:hypothetical protein [Tepidisphaeraceae bacterium]